MDFSYFCNMTKNTFILLLLFSFFSVYSQEVQEISFELKSGNFTVDTDFDLTISQDNAYRMIFFDELPTEKQKEDIINLGIQFLYYLPQNIFVVKIHNKINIDDLRNYKIKSINKLRAEYKIDPKLQQKTYPEWSMKNGFLYLKLLLHSDVNLEDALIQIEGLYEHVEEINKKSHAITIAINDLNLDSIANLASVSYIEPIDPPPTMENMTGRTLHRTNVINVEYSNGRNYNGEGVNIMMHDDGYVEPHIDRKGRVDEQFCFSCSSSSNDSHGDHVSGTIMGAGNLDPQGRGMADGAFLYVMGYSTNNYYQNVASLHTNYDVVITSASYGNGCNAGYTSLASDLDEQLNTYPSLIHVFSAGNDGSSNCGYGAGAGWGNITGGHKQAKNVIAVGNLDYSASLASSSSRGPAADGRIKPDICAQGTNVYSTYPNYTYNTISGTSMACPGVSGVMAQLYQAYKEYNSGVNPPSALMKCILLNSADDIGNPGPDFKHGWGVVNAFRALKLIESSNYINSSISQSATNSHIINVPNGTSQLKLMVYWHDKEGSPSANVSLVNNINISMSSSSGVNYYPFVLNSSANSSSLDQYATTGTDNLNNMEQIVINNPSPGNYTLYVNGSAIPYGPQEYSVSYEFINDDVELTYPVGGEGFVPFEYEAIRWDAIDNNMTFTLEYSLNNGATWNTIGTNISSSQTFYPWYVPNSVTSQAKIRISRGNSVSESTNNFSIISVPTNLSVYWPCPDSINVSWSSVSGATSYEVSMLGQKYMDSLYTTNTTNVWIINPNPNTTESWFSVSAKVNNGKGRRAVAVNAQAINSICSGYGCTDQTAYNYSPIATFNDGSCCYVAGCMDPTAVNFDPLVCYDDGSCVAPVLGCTDPSASNYDASANTTIASGGAVDNTFGTGGYFYGDQHLNFDATKECIIRSATVYSEASNTITFELRNSVGTVIDDTTLNVSSGQQIIDLNFEVPIGNDMQLGVAQGALQNVGLYRNNASASYPYDIGSAINITSSSASSAPYDYYYFYYDIEVETPCQGVSSSSWDCDGQGGCYDPGTGNGQYSSLTACQSNCIAPSWDCDGGTCFDPGNGLGQYNSLVDCEANCGNVSIQEFGLRNFKIYPNPSEGIFNIEFISEVRQDLNVRIVNMIGEFTLIENLEQFLGSYKTSFNLSSKSSGVYFLEIITNDGVLNHKIVLQ